MNLYREVDFEKEPCQFVGVHCVRWHNHPDQPSIGFVEVNWDQIPEVKELKQAFESQLTTIEKFEARVGELENALAGHRALDQSYALTDAEAQVAELQAQAKHERGTP